MLNLCAGIVRSGTVAARDPAGSGDDGVTISIRSVISRVVGLEGGLSLEHTRHGIRIRAGLPSGGARGTWAAAPRD
jgi:hypothetical protein